MSPRYIVGIDLGTTNTVAAFVETEDPNRAIRIFEVPQLVAEADVRRRPTLPSFCYLAGEHDLPAGSLDLPWKPDPRYVVGEFARTQGARLPGRLVSSAKSWLCHGGVDRTAAILPWGSPDDVPRISPVEASARYLAHVREAWNRDHPDAPLESQSVVLTVPASFDEVARELTVEAAQNAGLPAPTLIEEPQAAFYAWLADNEARWEAELEGCGLALVIDVGGGTTDFSLIAVRTGTRGLELERIAVGDHLLLGGDNMDLALARLVEEKLGSGERLDALRWQQVAVQCRTAKETILGNQEIAEKTIRLMGRGTAVVGAARTATLSRSEVERSILEGFFPRVGAQDMPRAAARPGLREWGLPFATEPEIPRHLAAFLARQGSAATPGGKAPQPDLLLFNGGALVPPAIRARLAGIVSSWLGRTTLRVLETQSLQLAVARGAAYYALARRGRGVRIQAGSPRALYLGVEAGDKATVRALCLVPRGMPEGEEVALSERAFELRANQPAAFPLYASSVRTGDGPGDLVTVAREALSALPPIRTVLRFGKKRTAVMLPVHLVARLTELGTLEIWCHSRTTPHRWRLQFQLRSQQQASVEAPAAAEILVPDERLTRAAALLRETFSRTGCGNPITLMRSLEEALEAERDAWPLAAIRKLWDALWEVAEGRNRSPDHEARWLNVAGFFLRPGFGDPVDVWRVNQIWTLFPKGVVFHRARQARAEWWNLWKRVAGGLERVQQERVFDAVAPWLLPRRRAKLRDGRSKVGPQEVREMWQAVGACERLSPAAKAELGEVLVGLVERGKVSDQELWALARLGARQLLYGPVNCVVSAKIAAQWVGRLVGCEWTRPEMTAFALAQIARSVGDRARDLDQELRRRAAERLRSLPRGERSARGVLETLPFEAAEQAKLLDESVPVGLRVLDSE